MADESSVSKEYHGSLKPMTSDFNIEQPQTTPDDTDEKRIKSVSRTKRWKEFKDFADGRVEGYRQFLPGSNPAITKSDDNWRVADCIIKELALWINFVEGGDI